MKTSGRLSALLLLVLFDAAAAQSPWVSTHGPCDDAIQAFSVHPAGYLFLGTNDNGVYRRNLAGGPWVHVSAGIENSNITDLLLRPSGAIVACGYGIVRSNNLGESWTTLYTGEFLMRIAANSSGHMFAGAWSAVLRSTDDGASWTPLQNGLPIAWVQAIEINAQGHLFAGTTWGIYRSTNSGNNWTFIGPTQSPTGIDLQDMAMNSNGWICAPTFFEGLWLSTNSGQSWSLTAAGLEDLLPKSVAIDNHNRILAGSSAGSVYESTNAGLLWDRINPEFRFSSIEAIQIDASALYAGSALGGVFCTTNGGVSWQQKNEGIAVAPVYKLAANSQGTIFARGYSLIWRSPDQGTTWIPTTFGDDGGSNLSVSPADHLFAPLGFGSAARSTDDGDTWTSLPIGSFVSEFGFTSNGFMFASGGGFHRSTDDGASWSLISNPFALGAFIADAHDHFIGGNNFGNVLRSTDGGFSWTDVGNISAGALSTAYVDAANRVFLGSLDGAGLFRSTNDGLSWHQLTNGLTDSVVWSVTGNDAGELFVATGTQGVFHSKDHGESWESFSNGLPAGTISSVVTTNQGFVYASLPDGGVYRTSVNATDAPPLDVLRPLALEQNAPNPFRDRTTIRYSLDRAADVYLKVYDVRGRAVATLVSGRKGAGSHAAVFDASSLPSGVYTYILSTPGQREARKLVLTR